MPVSLNPLENLLLMKMNIIPAPILDFFGGASFYAINAAVRLGIFETLSHKPLTVAELADKVRASETGTAVVLDVLESLGYVKTKQNTYRNTRMTQKWMTATSSVNINTGFEYYYTVMNELWPYLYESILKGEPHTNFYQWLSRNPETASLYQKFMMTLAALFIPDLVKKLKLEDTCRNLIDIGGGHALYSIALCKKYSDLQITIFDSPYTKPLALENIEKTQVNDRIRFVEGDYMIDDIGNGYDAAFLCNVIHEHSVAENEQLVNRIRQSLSDHGCIIILDNVQEIKISKTADFLTGMFSLLYFLSLGGKNYSFTEISGWLKKSGYKKVKRVNLGLSGLSLVIGYV
ncbi:methyltransferase [Chloroflexota bacterium]